MKLYNDTSHSYKAIINGKEYAFNKKESINFDCTEETKVVLKCTNKSSVHLNWIDMILGVFFGDSTVTMLYCDYAFQIQNSDDADVTIKNNDWHPREQLGIMACYADADVTGEEYLVPDISKIKRKHKNLHLFVSSLFPIGIILFILCFLFSPPVLFILLFAIWLFIFGVPSIKEIKRFKKAVNQEYMNKTLCGYARERRAGGTRYDETTSKIGRMTDKLLNKMFKFDEEK
ncbi:MAG: PRA1 family protein [Clostridium sp.]|nr:PRA1 family protein [Clostridium sp.]